MNSSLNYQILNENDEEDREGNGGEKEKSVQVVTLQAGDLLYIPNGLIHEAFTQRMDLPQVSSKTKSQDQQMITLPSIPLPSLHLTFGIEISGQFSNEFMLHCSLQLDQSNLLKGLKNGIEQVLDHIKLSSLSEQEKEVKGKEMKEFFFDESTLMNWDEKFELFSQNHEQGILDESELFVKIVEGVSIKDIFHILLLYIRFLEMRVLNLKMNILVFCFVVQVKNFQ